MKINLNYLSLIIIFASISGCSASKNAGNNRSEMTMTTPLRGIYWRLTALSGESLNQGSSTGKEAFIKFNIDGKSVGGNGGCNSFGGSYEFSDGSHLSFGPIMSTKMYCEDAKFENTFFNILSKTDNYLISGDTLFLRNKGMDSTAKFVADYLKK
ncbi:MAG: META domain-containing protein [Ginsengibacter sp.]|jgi:heat shock protein HslJ